MRDYDAESMGFRSHEEVVDWQNRNKSVKFVRGDVTCMALDKPRLRLFMGIWMCIGKDRWMSFGDTPVEAYERWKRNESRH
jgi:hypothetical protein